MNWLEDEVENREEDEDIYGDDDDEDDDFLSDEEFEEQYFNSLNDNDVEECFCLTGNKYKYKKVDIKFYVNTESNKTNLLRLLVLFLAECVKIEKNEKYFEEYERKKGKLLKEQSMYKNDEFINSLFKK